MTHIINKFAQCDNCKEKTNITCGGSHRWVIASALREAINIFGKIKGFSQIEHLCETCENGIRKLLFETITKWHIKNDNP